MKKLLIALTLMLASNAFATTYYAQYSTLATHSTTSSGRYNFVLMPAPTQGAIAVYTLDDKKQPTYLKQEAIVQSPLNLTINYTKTSATITDAANNLSVVTPAQLFTKPLTGAFIGGQMQNPQLGAVPVIDNKVKETVANALGNNNFNMLMSNEINTGSCNMTAAKTVECVIGIVRIYTIEAE
jgi:hypothetical protein